MRMERTRASRKGWSKALYQGLVYALLASTATLLLLTSRISSQSLNVVGRHSYGVVEQNVLQLLPYDAYAQLFLRMTDDPVALMEVTAPLREHEKGVNGDVSRSLKAQKEVEEHDHVMDWRDRQKRSREEEWNLRAEEEQHNQENGEEHGGAEVALQYASQSPEDELAEELVKSFLSLVSEDRLSDLLKRPLPKGPGGVVGAIRDTLGKMPKNALVGRRPPPERQSGKTTPDSAHNVPKAASAEDGTTGHVLLGSASVNVSAATIPRMHAFFGGKNVAANARPTTPSLTNEQKCAADRDVIERFQVHNEGSADHPICMVISADSSRYQAWQVAALVHSAHGKINCTILVMHEKANASVELRREMRTLVDDYGVHVLLTNDFSRSVDTTSYPPYNRIVGLSILLPTLKEKLGMSDETELSLLLADPDMVLARPVHIRAKPGVAVGQLSAYMKMQTRPATKIFSITASSVVDVAAPVIILHRDLLRVVEEWFTVTKMMRAEQDKEIFDRTTWITEMLSYAIASSNMGVTHVPMYFFHSEPPHLTPSMCKPFLYHYAYPQRLLPWSSEHTLAAVHEHLRRGGGLELLPEEMKDATSLLWSFDKKYFRRTIPLPRPWPAPEMSHRRWTYPRSTVRNVIEMMAILNDGLVAVYGKNASLPVWGAEADFELHARPYFTSMEM